LKAFGSSKYSSTIQAATLSRFSLDTIDAFSPFWQGASERSMNNDRRADQRVTVNYQVKWHGAAGGFEGRLEDLSANGCFVNTRGPADVGEIVSLLIRMPQGGWLPMRGKVRFFQQLTGFSLSFSILDEKEREALDKLISNQS
jgi:hypothetical protein